MPRKTAKRRYRHLVAHVMGQPWAILPEKFGEIMELVELRSAGYEFTREEVAARIGKPERPEMRTQAGQIAMLNLFGVITQRANFMTDISGGTSAEMFAAAFDGAVKDPNVSAIVINTDSPGGAVVGTFELAQKVFDARGTKPIIAIANAQMASAAYLIASAADEIVSAPSAVSLGSVGVISVHSETSKADAEAGITHEIVRSVENKAAINDIEPLTEKAREHLKETVQRIHERFVEAVALHRDMPAGSVNSVFDFGRVFDAEQALQRGIIDRIATLEEVLGELGVSPSQSRTAVRAQTGGPRGSSSIISFEGWNMDPKILERLVQMGLCSVDASEDTAKMILRAWTNAKGLGEPPEDTAKILEMLKAPAATASAPVQQPAVTVDATTHATQPAASPATAPAATTPSVPAGMSVEDIIASIRLSGLPAETALEIQAELVPKASQVSFGQVADRINQERMKANPPAGSMPVQVTADSWDKMRTAARDGILARAWGGSLPTHIYEQASEDPVEWKRPARNHSMQSLPELSRALLIQAGVPSQKAMSLDNGEVARIMCGKPLRDFGIFAAADGPSYNVTGMFSNIFLDAANVMLRRSYMEANTTFQTWMRQAESLRDFKPVHKVIGGELPDPKAIPEDGEFEETTLTESRESYKLTVWGEVFSMTWQMVVNDQLGSFTEIPMKQGRAMRRKQNKLAYGVLIDNVALSDGTALFHADHNNLKTGAGAPSVSTLNDVYQGMAEQSGLSAATTLNIEPQWIIVPPALRGTVLELLSSTSNPASSDGNPGVVNIWQNGLQPVIDPQLGLAAGGSDVAWYTAANSMDVDTIEYAYMQGLETPAMDSIEAFDRLAQRFRMYQAFAVKAIDFRGLRKNAGE